jgi:dihydroceramide fatty acyl 2-hydroxylase
MEFIVDGNLYRIPQNSFFHPGGDQVWMLVCVLVLVGLRGANYLDLGLSMQVLVKNAGEDVSRLFSGDDRQGHAHSPEARASLRRWFVGPALRASHQSSVGRNRQDMDSAIDLTRPIIPQLRLLRHHYSEWIDRPTTTKPIFFENRLAESITKVKWWVVPLLWLPVVGICYFKSSNIIGNFATVRLAMFGMLLWQVIEYGLHRFLFHWKPKNLVAVYISFLFHGCHHKFPCDVDRLVFPPIPAAAIASCIFRSLCLYFPLNEALAVFSGVLLGYVLYDCCHYFIHAGWLKNNISINHMHHHYVDHSQNYGITSPVLDILLGSSSDTCKNR